HHAHASAETVRARRSSLDQHIADANGAALVAIEPGETAEQRGLAGAALADHRRDRTGRHVEGHVVERRHCGVAMAMREADAGARRDGGHALTGRRCRPSRASARRASHANGRPITRYQTATISPRPRWSRIALARFRYVLVSSVSVTSDTSELSFRS